MDRIATIGLWFLAARAFARARWRQRTLSSRAAIASHHRAQLARLATHACTAHPFYRRYAGKPFSELPVIDKTILLDNFADLNIAGLDAETVRHALASGTDRARGMVIGQSTGTSGNRGYYVISDEERFVWLGTILAKTLPDALWRRHRVALALPGMSSLYRSAGGGGRITLAFFDLAAGVDAWANQLSAFAPDTIVAPPKVLRWLAERGKLPARHIFSGAEVLDPLDRAIVEDATGHRVREIYMATEGLFGVSCAHGRLHLAEDVVHFEWEQPDPASTLRAPIVTDFTRRAQAMIRYRMNDLLEPDDGPCACGSALRPVRQIVGRRDDILLIADGRGGQRMVTPDILRNAVVDSNPAIRDFRIVQTAMDAIDVTLEAHLPAEIDTIVKSRLTQQLAAMALAPRITIRRGIEVPFDRKLRRVMRAGNQET